MGLGKLKYRYYLKCLLYGNIMVHKKPTFSFLCSDIALKSTCQPCLSAVISNLYMKNLEQTCIYVHASPHSLCICHSLTHSKTNTHTELILIFIKHN